MMKLKLILSWGRRIIKENKEVEQVTEKEKERRCWIDVIEEVPELRMLKKEGGVERIEGEPSFIVEGRKAQGE